MFATAVRWAAKKGKPKMAPIDLTTPPEQTQSITRAIFDVVREHGPLTISDVWDHVKVSAHPARTQPVRRNVCSAASSFSCRFFFQKRKRTSDTFGFREEHLDLGSNGGCLISHAVFLQDVGLRGLTSKRQMKIMMRWMRERQKLRLICDHDGPHKQFLYTTWFTNPKNAPPRPKPERSPRGEPHAHLSPTKP
jgi:hypothetical protein